MVRVWRARVWAVQVLVVGSQNPTYESVALAYGAREVVVSEYVVWLVRAKEHCMLPVPLPRVAHFLTVRSVHTLRRYQLPPTTVPGVRYVYAPDLPSSGEKFDAIISISSVEHDGLGRQVVPPSRRVKQSDRTARQRSPRVLGRCWLSFSLSPPQPPPHSTSTKHT